MIMIIEHLNSATYATTTQRLSRLQQRYCIGVSRRSAQATVSEGLAQGPYMAARAGVEPTTLRLKVIDSTKAPPCLTNVLDWEIEAKIGLCLRVGCVPRAPKILKTALLLGIDLFWLSHGFRWCLVHQTPLVHYRWLIDNSVVLSVQLFTKMHPETIVIDPINNVMRLLDRRHQYRDVRDCDVLETSKWLNASSFVGSLNDRECVWLMDFLLITGIHRFCSSLLQTSIHSL